MVLISVLTPTVEQAGLNSQDYRSYCHSLLGTEKLQLCKLVPLEPGEACEEVVVRLDAGMSLQSVETLLEEKDRFEGQLTQAKEALRHFASENAKLKELLSQNKGQRMRSLEDENRKLRSVLQ